ncbi:MAG: twin-arginine translocase TatA/TatE family subunit [Myxococcota bacterium]|nr:twin-arginine translocase TatA/TatE family subunit [Myxococcota bacterium]
MLPNLAELVIILLIIFVIFGMGKLPSIASRIGRLRSQFKRGLESDETVDITPEKSVNKTPPGRKPGKFEATIDEAKVEDA